MSSGGSYMVGWTCCFMLLMIGVIISSQLYQNCKTIDNAKSLNCTVTKVTNISTFCQSGPQEQVTCFYQVYEVHFSHKGLLFDGVINTEHTASLSQPHYDVGSTHSCYFIKQPAVVNVNILYWTSPSLITTSKLLFVVIVISSLAGLHLIAGILLAIKMNFQCLRNFVCCSKLGRKKNSHGNDENAQLLLQIKRHRPLNDAKKPSNTSASTFISGDGYPHSVFYDDDSNGV